ncbi:hypothetical protein FDH86_gp103 [Arthrobacter phage Tank]|uniref:Uncharacterized protein n=2 Tax=Tankvirus tank TaxID=1982567 RepID=A0A0U4B7C2_9CAUD|nr:hypothetical protein FDH86_gp103 [Arthrobacter phage Tank]ALY10638.1 hypothetical protein TANK_103 [Arthrobacter phage Tank]ALY10887.1 hypothetical protein WILDE_106 [Arthrobacter phage Wilde]
MKLNALTASAAALVIVSAGLTIGALSTPTVQGVGQPTQIPVSIAAQEPMEDEPGFDCQLHGNRACGNLTESDRALAWDAWDSNNGWSKLRTSCKPSQGSRIDVVGNNHVTAPRTEGEGEVALPGTNGVWYLFTEQCI